MHQQGQEYPQQEYPQPEDQFEYNYPVHSSAGWWPNDQKFRDELSVPITLSFSPLQAVAQQASFPSNKINSFRCHSCKAFANYLCVIRSENEYDCSICGCTNRVPLKLSPSSPEFSSPIYSCITTNPSHRQQRENYRTYIFAIDVSQYQDCTGSFVHYAVETIRQFCHLVREGGHVACRISIFAFHDCVQEYGVDSQGQVNKLTNTHLEHFMSGEDLDIRLPQQIPQVQQILADIILEVARSKPTPRHTSKSFLKVVENILTHFSSASGKVFVISGMNQPPLSFSSPIEEEPEEFRTNFILNKKKCLSIRTQQALEKTQLSVSFYLYNSSFINAMPLYVVAKLTNGEFKHYLPTNFTQFFYEFSHSLCEETPDMGTQTVLKVRSATGLKLVAIFGQYRNYKGCQDQVELLSCPTTRSYMFEFVIEGKVQQSSLNVQFSILWTDQHGNRVFKVITHKNPVSGDCKQILNSITYSFVNNSYMLAVLHNMDLNVSMRSLQLTLQERCRKHIKSIQQYQPEKVKKASPYIIFTFFMMRHFLMNTKYSNQLIYDKFIDAKSRIMTSDITAIHNVWPAVYAVDPAARKIADMRFQDLNQAQESIVIDQGTFCYVFIMDEALKKSLQKKNKVKGRKTTIDLIGEESRLEQTSELLQEIRGQKICGYVEVVLMESLEGVCIFDERGPLSYASFLDKITAN